MESLIIMVNILENILRARDCTKYFMSLFTPTLSPPPPPSSPTPHMHIDTHILFSQFEVETVISSIVKVRKLRHEDVK